MDNGYHLSEKRIKLILGTFLALQGWSHEIAELKNSGIDIEAKRGKERWIIEINGAESLTPAVVSSFVSLLGKILQRMDDTNCKYSIAIPDTKPFRRLWERLPSLAKRRTGVTALFVSPNGTVDEILG